MREYILPTTNVRDKISRIHVKAWTSPALLWFGGSAGAAIVDGEFLVGWISNEGYPVM